MALYYSFPWKSQFFVRLPSKWASRGLQLAAQGDFGPKKPPPFDFLSTGYPQWLMFDKTKHRFTENTKFICVEGNIACGKGHVAKKIAEYFGLDYRPDPTDDTIFTLKNYNPPVDVRMHNTMLPKEAQYFTTEMFWTEENLKENGKPMELLPIAVTSRIWLSLKLFLTVDTFQTHDWFGYLHANTALNLWKPHLIVYIKASNDQIREGIKKKGITWQINAKNLNEDFFSEYRKSLEMYLEKMSRYCEIFVIDRTGTDIYNEDDLLIIMEKLADIDYEGERLIRDDYKFLEWRNGLLNEQSATDNRARFSSAMMKFTTQFKKFHMPLDMTDGVYSFDAKELQYLIYKRDPRLKYRPGYDPSKDSITRILFDPWLEKRNFRKDWPTYFLTFY
ncbi:NADH dehydrogenase ubiquinone 1 alpha subcomplex subunit 10 mitochondrial [Taenia crassiceps]|uniref:NADH dehydrogenase ubiquinone 1 alpha subcomplex subunit 10 mitochondrial n=1 Tax=Taenia crassiceps TaxID=6207 RepID=A0ABR4Q347_9CEST